MYNFDEVIDRRGTGAVKWEKYRDADVLPFWVADMDFRAPPFVLDAIGERLRHGILGYTDPPEELIDAVRAWLKREFRWDVTAESIVWIPGVVPGLNLACRAVGEPGTSVLIPVPVYYPFLSVPDHAGRVAIECPLSLEHGRWIMRIDPLERAVRPDTRLFMLCNPQNPTGRVYAETELVHVAELCSRHDLVICSDEIHCGLVLDSDKRHIPIASLSPEIAARTITLMAPTKTYNIPGIPCAFAIIPNTRLKQAFLHARAGLVHGVGPIAVSAALAAYRDRSGWLGSLIEYLRGNRDLLEKAVAGLRGVSTTHVEGTCLAWIDTRTLGLDDPAAFFERHGIGLSSGAQFHGPGYVRFNFGCPRSTLEEGLRRFVHAVQSAGG